MSGTTEDFTYLPMLYYILHYQNYQKYAQILTNNQKVKLLNPCNNPYHIFNLNRSYTTRSVKYVDIVLIYKTQ